MSFFIKLLCRNILALMIVIALSFSAFANTNENLSGRLVIVTSFPESLFGKFSKAFEKKFPEIKVFVRNKKTSAAISFIEERVDEPADLFWASAPDAFEILKESGNLMPTLDAHQPSNAMVGAYPIDDRDGYYKGFAISGYGIAWNNEYLKKHGLTPPRQWRDLADQSFSRHIGISAPSRSGTTHLIAESILQSQGWEEGWATLLAMGGNLATVTARSFGVIDGILAERFGVGTAIDFLCLSAKASGAPVGFSYPNGTAFLPASIAIVKRSSNPVAAQAFIDFVLSEQGQQMLFDPLISRLPVMQTVYESAPDGYANPFSGELISRGIKFDVGLSRQRYHLVNSLFDIMITFRQQALRRTWRAIHEAESALADVNNPVLKSQIAEARRLASIVPLTREESQSSTLTSIFVRHKPGLSLPAEQSRIEASWSEFARKNQDRAYAIAKEVMAGLQVMQ